MTSDSSLRDETGRSAPDDTINIVPGLVMAAGFSTRFGDKDKRIAGFPQNGSSTGLLSTTLNNVLPAFIDADGQCCLAVVLRPEDSAEALGVPPQCRIIHAPNAAAGLGASIADALTVIAENNYWPSAHALALILGDMPELRAETITDLTQQISKSTIIRPYFNGKPGHPVLFGRTFWTQLSKNIHGEGARQIIKNNQQAFKAVEVSDPGVLFDIDTPDQLSRA